MACPLRPIGYGAGMKIIIRNLSPVTSEEYVEKLFTPFGAVQYCNLVMNAETGLSKGFGFVEMPKAGEAKQAIKALNNSEHDGVRIRVKKAETKIKPQTLSES